MLHKQKLRQQRKPSLFVKKEDQEDSLQLQEGSEN